MPYDFLKFTEQRELREGDEMKRASGVLPTATWAKSHWIVVSLFLFFVVLAVIMSWFFVASTRPASHAISIVTSAPLPLAPVLSTNILHISTIQAAVQNNGHSTAPVTTQIQVNGQQVQAPPTGTIHKVIQDPNGTTTVDISVDAQSPNTATSSTSSSTSVQLNSTSEVTSGSESGQQVP